MELKDLEEMFKMEQELDIPHRDRWYNKDFDKRELEAEQSVKNCNIPLVSDTVCEHEWDLYENKQGELIQYCHKCNSVEQTDC